MPAPRPQRFTILAVEQLDDRITPTTINAVNEKGINLLGLGLIGNGVSLGQIEFTRPGLTDHPQVRPTKIYDADQPGDPAFKEAVRAVGGHATAVASVIIGTQAGQPPSPATPGVAVGSKLYSAAMAFNPHFYAAYEALGKNPNAQAVQELNFRFFTRTLANLGRQGLTAVNMSLVKNGDNPAQAAARESLMIDYMSSAYGFLMVTGLQNDASRRNETASTSAFNSIKVGALGLVGDVYARSVTPSPATVGDRSLIEILAPGTNIPIADFADLANLATPRFQRTESGTSLATPFVTSAVADLTQYVRDRSIPPSAAVSYVLKAIVLNSADKLEGELPGPDGVGMTRTITSQTGKDWRQYGNVIDVRDSDGGENATRQAHALNPDIGVGALDVRRAVTQINGSPAGVVDKQGRTWPIGWDGSGLQNNRDEYNDSKYGQILRRVTALPSVKAGAYFSATLSWERPVTMKNAAGQPTTGPYQPGFTFDGGPYATKPPNLDLYLVKKGATTIDDPVWASNSQDGSVEHFFFQMPNPGDKYYSANGYELWVISKDTQLKAGYGLAWWGQPGGVGGGGGGGGEEGHTLEGSAWRDLNGDGLRGTGEPVEQGVHVALVDDSGVTVDTALTDWQGRYVFQDVADGSYHVDFSNPHGFGFTTQDAGTDDTADCDVNTSGSTGWVTVSGSDVANVDAGLVLIAGHGSVGGTVYVDKNGDGAQGPGEPGLSGTQVDLVDAVGVTVATTSTGSDGGYQFTDVDPGTYTVVVTPPTGTTVSTDTQTWDLTVYAGDSVTSVGTGVFYPGSATGVVWGDADRDGIRDAGEGAVEGATVVLFDGSGQPLDVTSTDADGVYTFDGLSPGNYSTMFLLPDGYGFSPPDQGTDDATDSDADPFLGLTADFVVSSGASASGGDAGLLADDLPAPASDTASTAEDSPVTIPVLTNDADLNGDTLQVIYASGGGHGTVAYTATGITYNPDPGWSGTDSFAYWVSDGFGATSATVTVTVTPVNDPPIAGDDALSAGLEDTVRTIAATDLLGNDSPGPDDESDQALTVVWVGDATGGTVSLAGSNVVFTPTADYNGPAGFDYVVQDNGTTNGSSDPRTTAAHVSFTITPVNDPPSFDRGLDQTVYEDSGAQWLGELADAIDGSEPGHYILRPQQE
jgi:hypothetical protein